MLDTQMSRVVKCNADGRLIRTLGQAGDGPGELTGPKDHVAFSDGTLGLVAEFPGRMVYLNPDETPAGVHHAPCSLGRRPISDPAPGRFAREMPCCCEGHS